MKRDPTKALKGVSLRLMAMSLLWKGSKRYNELMGEIRDIAMGGFRRDWYAEERLKLRAQIKEARFWNTHHTWTHRTDGRIEQLERKLKSLSSEFRAKAHPERANRRGKS